MKIRVRHQGYSHVIDVKPDMTFRELAADLFKTHNITTDLAEYCFRVQNHDVYFKLSEQLAKLLEIAWVFRETDIDETGVEVTIALIRQAEKGDTVLRQKTTPDANMETIFVGYLYKRGRSTFGNISGFKRRWFTLQSNTLFYSISPQDAVSGFIPCIDLKVQLRPENSTKDKTAFELLYSDPTALSSATPVLSGSRSRNNAQGDRMCYSLLADERELPFFLDAVETLQIRTAKAAFVNIGQELLSRGPETLHGVFRVSGSNEQVQHLKKCIDYGLGPDLSREDTHTLSAVAKLYLRQLSTPLIPYGLYNDFLRIGKMDESEERTQFAIESVQKLPPLTLHFLHYICDLMHAIARCSPSNAMTSENLSICLSPNLLRPEKETPQTTINDNKFVIAAIRTLFEECEQIFGPYPAHRYTSSARETSGEATGYPQHALPPLPVSPAHTQQSASPANGPRLTVYPPPKPSGPLKSPSHSHSDTQVEVGEFAFMGGGRSRNMSIADLDFELSYFEDLKAVRSKTKRLTSQINQLQKAHDSVMTKWDELINAIKTNPQASVSMAEFILERTELNTAWVDEGIDELNHIESNLSGIVHALKQYNDQIRSSQDTSTSTTLSVLPNSDLQDAASPDTYSQTAAASPAAGGGGGGLVSHPVDNIITATPPTVLSLEPSLSSSSSYNRYVPSSPASAQPIPSPHGRVPPPIPPSPRAAPHMTNLAIPGLGVPSSHPLPPPPRQQTEHHSVPASPVSVNHMNYSTTPSAGSQSGSFTHLPVPSPTAVPHIPPPPPRPAKAVPPIQPQAHTDTAAFDDDDDDAPPPPPPDDDDYY